MALEEQIAALIVALNENTAAMKESIAVRQDAVKVVQSVANKTKTEAAPAAAETPAAAPVAAAAETPAAAPVAAAAETPAAAPASDAYEGVREIIAEYLGVERPEERKARQEKVIALMNHEKIRKPDAAVSAKPDLAVIGDVPLFKEQMRLLKEKGDLTTPESAALV